MAAGDIGELLDEGLVFEVLDLDHPVFNWYAGLFDEVLDEDVLIDRMVVDLMSLRGVRQVVREDRGVVLVAGDVDARTLEAWLDAWWRSSGSQV